MSMDSLRSVLGGALNKVKKAKEVWDKGASPPKPMMTKPMPKKGMMEAGAEAMHPGSKREEAIKDAMKGL